MQLSAKSYMIEQPWIMKLALSKKIHKRTNLLTCSTNTEHFEYMLIAMISHISERIKQTLRKSKRKKFEKSFHFGFILVSGATSWKNLRRADGKSFETETWNKVPSFRISAWLQTLLKIIKVTFLHFFADEEKSEETFEKSLWRKPICLTSNLAQDYQTLQSHFLEFSLFFQKREILTCVLVLCGFCTFSNSMSAQLYVDEAIWPKLGTAPRPFDQNITGGISTSLLFKLPTPHTFLLLAQILPAHYPKIQFTREPEIYFGKAEHEKGGIQRNLSLSSAWETSFPAHYSWLLS